MPPKRKKKGRKKGRKEGKLASKVVNIFNLASKYRNAKKNNNELPTLPPKLENHFNNS
jgi:hypothetical protein